MQLHKAILIIGQISSGKSTLANRLFNELNMGKASFGGYLLHYCDQMGIADRSRENLQAVGQQLIDAGPASFLQAVIGFSAKGCKEVIFEGVRHLSILDEIQQISGDLISVYLDATFDQRLKRYLLRPDKAIDMDRSEAEFNKAISHPVEQEVPSLRSKCAFVITSSDDPEMDYAALKAILSQVS